MSHKNPPEILIPVGKDLSLPALLHIDPACRSLVIFVHGSGSSRFSSRNQFVANRLASQSTGTLLFDLLTPEEDSVYDNRFNIPLLTDRLLDVTRWVAGQNPRLRIGLFGASTGAAAALSAAAVLKEKISAVVSRGGRPDLAGQALELVVSPTLLIVGGNDTEVIQLNSQALKKLHCKKELKIIPGATHLFEERGAMEQVAKLAAVWLEDAFSRQGL